MYNVHGIRDRVKTFSSPGSLNLTQLELSYVTSTAEELKKTLENNSSTLTTIKLVNVEILGTFSNPIYLPKLNEFIFDKHIEWETVGQRWGKLCKEKCINLLFVTRNEDIVNNIFWKPVYVYIKGTRITNFPAAITQSDILKKLQVIKIGYGGRPLIEIDRRDNKCCFLNWGRDLLHNYTGASHLTVLGEKSLEQFSSTLVELSLVCDSPLDISSIIHPCKNLKTLRLSNYRKHSEHFGSSSVLLPSGLKHLEIFNLQVTGILQYEELESFTLVENEPFNEPLKLNQMTWTEHCSEINLISYHREKVDNIQKFKATRSNLKKLICNVEDSGYISYTKDCENWKEQTLSVEDVEKLKISLYKSCISATTHACLKYMNRWKAY